MLIILLIIKCVNIDTKVNNTNLDNTIINNTNN